MNKFILSVVFFVSLSSLLQAQNEQVQLADSLIKRSQQFSQSLQYDSSLYYQKKALPIYLENELMYKYYLTQTQIAYSLAKAQQIQPALDLLGEVEVKVKEDTSLNLLAEVKRNEAIVYETVGNFEKAIALYPIIQFLMNQMGYGRGMMTPSVYAKTTVDTLLGTRYADLMEIYLKIKYSNESLTSEEEAFVHDFYEDFQNKFRAKFSVANRLLNFLKVNRWFYYLINLNIT